MCWASHLQAAVAQAATQLASGLAKAIGEGEGLPLARVVPAAEVWRASNARLAISPWK